ncbi:MAG: hypothetical protein J3K34DRAFT_131084 [Monoraphidium minutum]|nr:MAG: hypothetical protein J3K34DRAFT_131084 [Monoraphidium minutum]
MLPQLGPIRVRTPAAASSASPRAGARAPRRAPPAGSRPLCEPNPCFRHASTAPTRARPGCRGAPMAGPRRRPPLNGPSPPHNLCLPQLPPRRTPSPSRTAGRAHGARPPASARRSRGARGQGVGRRRMARCLGATLIFCSSSRGANAGGAPRRPPPPPPRGTPRTLILAAFARPLRPRAPPWRSPSPPPLGMAGAPQ